MYQDVPQFDGSVLMAKHEEKRCKLCSTVHSLSKSESETPTTRRTVDVRSQNFKIFNSSNIYIYIFICILYNVCYIYVKLIHVMLQVSIMNFDNFYKI